MRSSVAAVACFEQEPPGLFVTSFFRRSRTPLWSLGTAEQRLKRHSTRVAAPPPRPGPTPQPATARALAYDNVFLFWERASDFPSVALRHACTIDKVHYICAGQFMMSEKAKLLGDIATRREIMASSDPAQQKSLRCAVSKFTQDSWEQQCGDIVFQGNLAKLFAHPLRQRLWTPVTKSSPKPARITLLGASVSRTMTCELSNLRFRRDSTFL